MKFMSKILRPAFGLGLFLSQFINQRSSFFTDNTSMLVAGASITLGGIALLILASVHLQRAKQANAIATTGPYRRIRHPIYTGIYVFSIGLGLLFFTWAWFLVLLAFIPLWWRECKDEERGMLEQYGEAYAAYQQRTKMWIPGLV